IALVAEALQLEEIAVTAEAERGTVNRALEEQRNASTIVSAVTAEQIQKSPDSDAGQAVQRVSGVTVQDGKYVFVRGLGERYTTTSLNGTRIPSPEPDRKVVPLDLFPAGLLEGITTSKTFTPEQPGDFSGAQVNLKTREFPAQRLVSLSISAGLNAAATGKDIIRAPRTGSEWLGFGGSRRELPHDIRDANTLAGLSQSTQNRFLTLFRSSWSAPATTGSPNGSFGLAVGGEGSVAGQQLGYIGSFTYSYGQEVREEESRATVVRSSNGTGTEAYSAYEGSSGRTSVLWGGLANLSTRLGENSKIALNNTYSRSADNEATFLDGDHRDWGLLQATRLTFTERSVRSNQLAGQHLLGLRHQISWALTSSGVRRNEPDRSDLLYERDRDPTTSALVLRWSTAPQAATRTFSDLKEDAFDLGLNYRLSLKVSGENAVKAGLLARRVDRDADSRAYDITQINLTDAERALAPEEIFDGGFAEGGRLRLTANANGGRYEAADRLVAGYVQGELQLTRRLRGVVGARLEHDRLDVDTRETQSAEIRRARLDDTDVLPALALTYALSDDQNLRVSASQTLSRPEYRELAPVRYFDILGNL
ncbi:MAG: TonB-dependent receptor domain-containing protein, partial [Gemmatimonadales bacterium]